ncbi:MULTISPECIES: hypothetical protein [Stenotrophomonas]|uniref:hypothetical protein n=1 Tax=Stenotrophomonas TaxID=40323 RepID=UPI0013123DE1|nr:hypothetical protein [Stenotrophomonas maltophilia]MCF3520224.1 hypothetical protein [Stenotrophomonas maltophilia]
MKSWIADAGKAVELCESWTKEVKKKINCEIYLFGSAIYKYGAQFDPVTSDLDLICVIPDEKNDAVSRYTLISTLQDEKAELELNMIPALCRDSCDSPGVSLVPVTTLELEHDIHKSGVRNFFARNTFLNLSSLTTSIGINLPQQFAMSDDLRQAIEYAQKTRNSFLSIAANGTGGIAPYRGKDPLPKSILRAAAQVSPDAEFGEWYDTRLGLENLHQILVNRRSDHPCIRSLFDEKISIIRGGRSQVRPELSPSDQLLLAEILFDSAQEKFLEITRYTNAASDDCGVAFSATTVNTLPDEPEITEPNSSEDQKKHPDVDLMINYIRKWRPANGSSVTSAEESLGRYLSFVVQNYMPYDGYSIRRNERMPQSGVDTEFDFIIKWFGQGLTKALNLPIELKRFKSNDQILAAKSKFNNTSTRMLLVIYDVPLKLEHEIEKICQAADSPYGLVTSVAIPVALPGEAEKFSFID